jgi:hypothetical protein
MSPQVSSQYGQAARRFDIEEHAWMRRGTCISAAITIPKKITPPAAQHIRFGSRDFH